MYCVMVWWRWNCKISPKYQILTWAGFVDSGPQQSLSQAQQQAPTAQQTIEDQIPQAISIIARITMIISNAYKEEKI